MGASLALAGLSACTKQPPEEILPYVEAPEKLIPGQAALLCHRVPHQRHRQSGSRRDPRLRPTKVEGNPQHPASMGGADVPDPSGHTRPLRSRSRSDGQLHRRNPLVHLVSRSHRARLEKQKASNGAGIRILTETVTSPTLFSQIQDALKPYPSAKWYQWDRSATAAAWARNWRSASFEPRLSFRSGGCDSVDGRRLPRQRPRRREVRSRLRFKAQRARRQRPRRAVITRWNRRRPHRAARPTTA